MIKYAAKYPYLVECSLLDCIELKTRLILLSFKIEFKLIYLHYLNSVAMRKYRTKRLRKFLDLFDHVERLNNISIRRCSEQLAATDSQR